MADITDRIDLPRGVKLALEAFAGLFLIAGVSCGGGQFAAPTSSPTPTATIEATPIATVSGCPLPSEGKGNIAGILVWRGQPWVNELGTITILKLYSSDVISNLEEDAAAKSVATVTSKYDGSFCFHDIDPGEYRIFCWCPPGCNLSGALSQLVTVTGGKTYWLGFDPYAFCSYPVD